MAGEETSCIPVVSAIIERETSSGKEILVQTRWKPKTDPIYSGTVEIPAGVICEYENVYSALRREVIEETGLVVEDIYPVPSINVDSVVPRSDGAFVFHPYCCQQQISGGRAWIGFVFLCHVRNDEPVAQLEEVRDIRWLGLSELKRLLEEHPTKFFTLQVGALRYYLAQNLVTQTEP